jgi:hypothetical protein
VAHYRIYSLNSEGHFGAPPKDIHVENDEEALLEAKRVLEGHDIEVWSESGVLRRFRLKIAVKPVDQIKAINLAIGKRCAYSKLLRCSSSPCLRYGSSRTPRRMTNQDVLHHHNEPRKRATPPNRASCPLVTVLLSPSANRLEQPEKFDRCLPVCSWLVGQASPVPGISWGKT